MGQAGGVRPPAPAVSPMTAGKDRGFLNLAGSEKTFAASHRSLLGVLAEIAAYGATSSSPWSPPQN